MIFESALELMNEQMQNGLYSYYLFNESEKPNVIKKYYNWQQLNVVIKDDIISDCVVFNSKFLRNELLYKVYVRGITIIVNESKLSKIKEG